MFVFLESDLKIYGCDDRIVAWSTLMDCNESCLVCQINQLDDGIMCYGDEYLPLKNKNKTSLCLKRVIS